MFTTCCCWNGERKNFFKLNVFMCVQDKITTFNEMKGNLKTHSCSFSRMCTLSDLKLPSHVKTIVYVLYRATSFSVLWYHERKYELLINQKEQLKLPILNMLCLVKRYIVISCYCTEIEFWSMLERWNIKLPNLTNSS